MYYPQLKTFCVFVYGKRWIPLVFLFGTDLWDRRHLHFECSKVIFLSGLGLSCMWIAVKKHSQHVNSSRRVGRCSLELKSNRAWRRATSFKRCFHSGTWSERYCNLVNDADPVWSCFAGAGGTGLTARPRGMKTTIKKIPQGACRRDGSPGADGRREARPLAQNLGAPGAPRCIKPSLPDGFDRC